jgi:hypothetical protein
MALASRHAEVIKTSDKVATRISVDAKNILRNIDLQKRIAGYLTVLPKSLKSPTQTKYLNELALSIPEVDPPSSFLEENPQINIAIEDNTGDYDEGTEISPNEALMFLKEVGDSNSELRRLVMEILSTNLNTLHLVYDELLPRMDKAGQDIAVLQRKQKDAIKSGKPIPNSFIQSVVAQPQPVSPPSPTPTYIAPNGLEFPLYLALRARVMEGGREGAKALSAVIDLWNEQAGARDMIRKSMVALDCKMLLTSPKTPEYIKELAGTLTTLITGTPVGYSVPDFKSGSFGHVTVVVPRPSRVYLADKETALMTGP